MPKFQLATTLLLASIFQLSFAADPDIYAHKKHGAIKGADAVAYFFLEPGDDAVIGDKNISYHYKGADWYFSTEKNRDLFVQSPEKYAPQFGGYCAFAVSHGFTKSVNPDYWHIVDNKLYLNYNFFADRKWKKDQQSAIQRGHENWPSALKSCEENENCNTE